MSDGVSSSNSIATGSMSKKTSPYSINLSTLSKQDLSKRDIYGRTILHLVILTNRYDLLKRLFKNPEFNKSVLTCTDYESGWNCLHYIIFHKKLSCFKAVMEHLKSCPQSVLFDLLRCKDRNRLTPLQLLDNDFKDLVWIPEYVDEMNEFSLKYRYKVDQGATTDSATSNSTTNITTTNTTTTTITTTTTTNSNLITVNANDGATQSSIRSSNDWWDPARGGSDILVLGSNKNNSLGLGDSNDRSIPSKVPHGSFHKEDDVDDEEGEEGEVSGLVDDDFSLSKPRYKKILLTKYHSFIITQSGEIFSCGIGSRGRLGHGIDDMCSYYKFKKVLIDDRPISVIAIESSNNHSICLTSRNEVYGWGLNTYNQLGFTTTATNFKKGGSGFVEIFEPSPRRIWTGDLKRHTLNGPIKGIAVSKIHSLVYTRDEIFSWGLCIGQMGISTDTTQYPGEQKINGVNYKGFVQQQPKKLTMRDKIKLVSTCETCTVVITVNNDIHVYYQYQHLKLPRITPSKYANNENQFHLFKPTALTKAVSIKKCHITSHGMIVFLLENGDVVKIDDFKTPKYSTVWKAHNFDMIAIDIDISSNGSIVLCTRSGSVFIRSGTTTSSSATMMSSSTSELLIGGRRGSLTESSLNISNGNKFKKIDNLNKIVRVSCDAQFLSFGFIRDEVDMIPLKLHKNSFFNDLMHLELNQASNLYRKQDELFIPDGPGNSYIKDFVFYKQKIKRKKVEDMFTGLTIDEDEDNDEEIEDESSEICDLYYKKHKERYSSQYKEVKSKHTYQKLSKLDRQVMFDDLKFKLEVNLIEMFDSKRFNCFIVVPEFPDIKIGIHKFIFMERSRFCWNIFQPEEPGEYFKFENITGRFDPESNEIQFNSHVNLKSLLIMIHFLYTNDVLSIWDDYPLGIHCPKDIKEIKTDFEMLVRLFQLSDVYGKLSKDEVYLKKMRQMYDSEIECDVVVELCDGTIACHSPILVTRSAYFETLLSNRWDDGEVVEKIIKFDNISQLHFDIVLKHLYGVSDTTIFSELMKEVKEIDEFINNILDLIEISDELLIFELKLLCELAIKDFINIDNVLILLQHSNFLSANKLFMNCCWFIYNNLEILLLDHSFKDLPLEILKKLEKQIDFISDCKLKSFEGSGVVYENWYEKNSNQLVSSFINNLDQFNENFIVRRGIDKFEPLFDFKNDRKKSRSVSRSHSINGSNNNSSSDISGLAAFRKGAETAVKTNGSAIDDDEEFEQVSYRRRKSSTPAPTPPLQLAPPVQPPGNMETPRILDNARGGSLSGTSGRKSFSERKSSIPGLSPHSNWATSPAMAKDTPILGNETERKSKVKVFLAPRLSQKERKKKALVQSTVTVPSASNSLSAPWASASSSVTTSTSPSPSSSRNSSLPILGGNSGDAENISFNKLQKQRIPKQSNQPRSTTSSPSPPPYGSPPPASGPSLAEIMILESLKIEEQQVRERERKSLQEIQQEQEFDKWWAEEAAKVQKNLTNNSSNKNNKQNKKFTKKKGTIKANYSI